MFPWWMTPFVWLLLLLAAVLLAALGNGFVALVRWLIT